MYAVRMAPADFQAVLRVEIGSPVFHAARERYGSFGVLTVRAEEAQGGLYSGELFFEGESLGQVSGEIEKTLYFRRTDEHAEPALRYLLFGEREMFLQHVPGAGPAFDQVLRVQFTGWRDPLLDPDAAVVVIVSGREDSSEDRLAPGEKISVLREDVRVVAEVYLRTEGAGGGGQLN